LQNHTTSNVDETAVESEDMMSVHKCVLVAAMGMTVVEATGVSTSMTVQSHRGNPIRKVVTLLQNIQKKVEKEGKAAEDLFDKFMCECGKQSKELEGAIAAAETKGSDVGAALEAGQDQAKQLAADIKQAKTDRAAAKEAIAAATGIREKEAAAYKGMHAEATANIEAMGSAIQAIKSGGGAFLQTDEAKKLIVLVQNNQEMLGSDRDDVTAFLQGEQGAEGSGEIVGVLSQQQETMQKDLSEAEAGEADAIKTYDSLVAAKTKEFETLQASIEEKMARLGELSVANAEAANDGGDTADQLAEDKKGLADLKTACAAKEKAWDGEKKTRAEEILALADTIKMLNSDEALEMFKKAIPSASASFMQVQVSEATVRARALAGLQAAKKHTKSTKLDFLVLALHGKKSGFGPVIAMIDKFIGALKAEQKDDDDKVVYCNAEFDKSDDEKKVLERKVSDAETAIKDAKESVATLIKEIEETKAAIVTLDQDVAISTAQRQAENADYKTLVEQNAAAKNLITMAKKRLNKFYNPSLVQVHDHSAAEDKKAEETGGVIAMMDLLVTDLDKETAVAETDEKNAQEDYETAMADAKEQRIADAKTLEEKESAKAEADDSVDGSVDAKKAADGELQGVLSYIMTLHADCDWILKFFDTRKAARTDEIDALSKAKDVLNGADYSLLQITHTHKRLRGA